MALASAHGRQKGNVIAGGEASIPSGEFLISGRHERGAEIGEFGVARGIEGEQVGQSRAGGQFNGFLCEAGEFANTAEEEDLHGDFGYDSRHPKIVT